MVRSPGTLAGLLSEASRGLGPAWKEPHKDRSLEGAQPGSLELV